MSDNEHTSCLKCNLIRDWVRRRRQATSLSHSLSSRVLMASLTSSTEDRRSDTLIRAVSISSIGKEKSIVLGSDLRAGMGLATGLGWRGSRTGMGSRSVIEGSGSGSISGGDLEVGIGPGTGTGTGAGWIGIGIRAEREQLMLEMMEGSLLELPAPPSF